MRKLVGAWRGFPRADLIVLGLVIAGVAAIVWNADYLVELAARIAVGVTLGGA